MWLSFVIIIIIILLIVYAILVIGTKKAMPKIPKHYEDFSGGLNSQKDPRDIADNELSDVNNMIGDQGQLRTMGALAAATGVTGTTDALAVKCYGLFVFSSDYDMPSNGTITGVADNGSGNTRYTASGAHGLATGDYVFHYGFSDSAYNGYKEITVIAGTTYDTSDTHTDTGTGSYVEVSEAGTSGEDYICVVDADNDANVDIMPLSDDTFHKGMVDVGSSLSIKMVLYYAGGALRVCDGHFGSSNANRWFGYIKRYQFRGTSNSREIDRWVEDDAEIAAPTRGLGGDFVWAAHENDANCTSTNIKASDATAFEDCKTHLGNSNDYQAYMVGIGLFRDITAADNQNLTTDALPLAITAGAFTDGGGGTINVLYNGHGLVDGEFVEVEDTTNYNGTYAITWVDANNVKFTHAYVADEAGDIRKTWRWNESYYIYPPAGTGFNFDVYSGTATGSWTAVELQFAQSFVYEGDQESLLFDMHGKFTPTADKELRATLFYQTPFDERISGTRIYYREAGSKDSWKLFIDIDMSEGARTSLTDEDYTWVTMHLYDPQSITYEAINGYAPDETSLYAEYKTATVGNNQSWIGHIKTTNDAGETVIYGDRVGYSPPGKYDVHPTSFYVDILPNDGDNVVALQFFADRLLVFKKEKLYIVNVAHGSDTGWFVEDTKSYMGVKTPAATFRTDYGIVWVNENGCFIFNGETVINLIQYVEAGMQQYKIKPSTWATFITNDAVVGFDPQTKKIIVVGDADATTGYCYIYDIATRSWWKGDKFSQDANHLMTNFAILNNELIIGRYSD